MPEQKSLNRVHDGKPVDDLLKVRYQKSPVSASANSQDSRPDHCHERSHPDALRLFQEKPGQQLKRLRRRQCKWYLALPGTMSERFGRSMQSRTTPKEIPAAII